MHQLLCVEYTAKPGMRDRFVEEAISTGVLDKILNEDGCLGYHYYYDTDDNDRILLVEEWENADKQKIHLGQPHMDILKEIKSKYIIDTQLKRATIE